MSRSHWTLIYGIAGKEKVRNAPVFTRRPEAAERARAENKIGPLKGRGVIAAPCDKYGNVDWSRVR